MVHRRRAAALFALVALPGCAALASWDGFTPGQNASEEPDGGAQRDTGNESKSDSATGGNPDGAVTPIAVVQTASFAREMDLDTADVPLKPVGAGNTIIVAAGWYSITVDIATIGDSQGNKYELAVGPSKIDGTNETITQKIFFAKNINAAADAGANTVHITFTAKVDTPDIRVAEVSGLDHDDPFIKPGADAKGRDVMITAGPVDAPARAILFAAATTEGDFSSCADLFTTCIISPQTNMAEIRIVDEQKSYTVTNKFPGREDFVFQLAAFK